MYQNLEQFVEEKVKELSVKFPWLYRGEKHRMISEYLEQSLRQCAELTAKAILEEGWTSDNEENRKAWLNKE